MENLFIIELNNKEYVFIDTYEYKGSTIFHFGNLEEEIFCRKIDNKYVPITDKFEFWMIKNKFGLIDSSECYDIIKLPKILKKLNYKRKINYVTDKQEFEIKQEQIENIKKIKEKFGLNLDFDRIEDRINNIKIASRKKNNNSAGVYIEKKSRIELNEEYVEGKNDIDKRVRLHETIHAITNKTSLYIKHFCMGLLEGQTENLVEDFLGNDTSSEKYDDETNYIEQYNFSKSTAYKSLVAIVKQMEHALGKKSYQSILDGKMDFEKDFAEKYGIHLLTYIGFRTRELLFEKEKAYSTEKSPIEQYYMIKYLRKTQNTILKNVYDKDFKKIESLEDAKKYFQKLKEHESKMVRISLKDKTKKINKEDNSFEKYYNKKLMQAEKLLNSKEVAKGEIKFFLEEHKYEKQEFKPLLTQKEHEEIIYLGIASYLDNCIKNGETLDLNEYKITFLKKPFDLGGICLFEREDGNGNYITILDRNLEIKKDIDEALRIGKFKNNLVNMGYSSEEIKIDKEELNRVLNEELKKIPIKDEGLNLEDKKPSILKEFIDEGKKFVRTGKLNLIIDKIKTKFKKEKTESTKEQDIEEIGYE